MIEAEKCYIQVMKVAKPNVLTNSTVEYFRGWRINESETCQLAADESGLALTDANKRQIFKLGYDEIKKVEFTSFPDAERNIFYIIIRIKSSKGNFRFTFHQGLKATNSSSRSENISETASRNTVLLNNILKSRQVRVIGRSDYKKAKDYYLRFSVYFALLTAVAFVIAIMLAGNNVRYN